MSSNITIEVGGERISAVHHPANSENWIFFCHGFGSNKEGSYIERCSRLQENGWNAVRFDFRGNGDSDGEFMEQTLSSRIEDLTAVIDRFNPESCTVFGSSFGGKVAFHTAAKDERIETFIGRAPVTFNETMGKYRAVVEEKGEFTHHADKTIDERFFKDLDKHPFSQVIESLETPVLIFQGSEDSSVRQKTTLKAVRKLQPDIAVHRFSGEGHRFSDNAEERMQNITCDWLQERI